MGECGPRVSPVVHGWSNPEEQDRRKRFLQEAPIDDPDKPQYRAPDEKYKVTDENLEDLLKSRTNSFTTWRDLENVHAKIYGTQAEFDAQGVRIGPGNTKVMNITQKNAGCLKTVFARSTDRRLSRKGVRLQQNAPIDEAVEMSKSEYTHVAIIIHNPELHVHGSAYLSMQIALENDKIFIVKREQKVLIDEQVKSMHDNDACMWSYFRTSTIPPRTARLRGMGCKTFMLELFCGVMTLTYIAHSIIVI